jgi:hypothetical protein
LEASDLNGEFNSILNNPISLISPLTANLDFNTFAALFEEVSSSPSTSANNIGLYAKDVGGITQLFVREPSSGLEKALTDSGHLMFEREFFS